jgi:hypothetical protein
MWQIKGYAWFLYIAALAVAGVAEGQKMCSVYASLDGSRGTPVIFGRHYLVPELKLRFLNATTGKPVSPDSVNIHYYSQWLMVPAPENSSGAWSDVDDWVRCVPGGQTEISVPRFTVNPRGWYDGKYVKFPYTLIGSKQPRFDRIEIVVEFDRSMPRLIIKEADLKQYRGAVAVVTLPPAGRAKVEFEKPGQ